MFFVKTTELDWIEADRTMCGSTSGRRRTPSGAHQSPGGDARPAPVRPDPSLHHREPESRSRDAAVVLRDYVVILEDATRLRLSRHYRDRVEKQVGV